MSVDVDTTATDSTDRSVAATHRLCGILSLGALKPKELKFLATALAEAASSEIDHNPAFGGRILAIYHELSAKSTPRGSRGSRSREKAPAPRLTAQRDVDQKLLGPDKPLDPYLLQYIYGDDQLYTALDRFPASTLKKAAATVEQRNPGTKPANRSQKAALLEYILAQLIGRPHDTY